MIIISQVRNMKNSKRIILNCQLKRDLVG